MIKYKQITLEEREKIYQLLKVGISLTKIAASVNRHKSTLYREIKRNYSVQLGYLPDKANNLATGRKNRLLCKIERIHELKSYIVDRLSIDKWSPEIIAGRIKKDNILPRISHESIYQYIYGHYGQKQKLYQHLMYARPKRQLKFYRKNRHKVLDEHKIANRPQEINSRKEFGHFEGDLTFFKGSKNGNCSVLVERLSRKSFIIKNNNKRSIYVMSNLLKAYSKLPDNSIKSITFDNGGEFKKFGVLGLKGTKVFFCDPGAPYQKGQVERTNAILHKFLPKKSDFRLMSDETVHHAQDKLNNLPRKCLNFLTPNEAWNIYANNAVALQC